MAPQAVRIILVFGFLGVAFSAFRSATVPESYGATGHFRQAAIASLASRPMKFEGRKSCIDCHDKNSPHTDKGVSCEACHGPGAQHSQDYDSAKMIVNSSRAACAICHAMNTARRNSFPQIDLQEHHPSQRCSECHQMHPEVAEKKSGAQPADKSAPNAQTQTKKA